jgi:hypothetical protein
MTWAGLLVLGLLAIIFLTLVASVAVVRTRWGLALPVMLLAGLLLGALLLSVVAVRFTSSPRMAARTTQAVTTSPDGQMGTSQGEATAGVESPSDGVENEAGLDDLDEPAIALEANAGKAAKVAKPAWVDRLPVQIGDAYQVSVASGPQEKLAECRTALDEQLKRAVAAYIDEYLESAAAGKCRVSDIVMYDLRYINKHLVKPGNTFEEKLQLSFGPMYQTHALLEFGPEFRRELDGRRGDLERYAQEVAVARRLRGLVIAFGAVISLLLVGLVWFHRRTPQSVG